MQNIFSLPTNNRMSSIVSTLAAHNNIGITSEDIDNFSFSFIPPLRANKNRIHIDAEITDYG